MIIDSNQDNVERLSQIIGEEGFHVSTAQNGMQGLVKFYQHKPDLVLIDFHAEGMSAIETCRQIKALASNVFVPVLMISTYLNDEQISTCVEAGADDIVFRPFSLAIFRSKIYAMFRIASLYSKLYTLTAERQNDEELAEQLFSTVVEKGNVAQEHINIFKRSAETFSGDVQLTALCPNGDINVLLGDFTGHGLSSAIGAIPLADTFRAMTDKGYSPIEIIKQINRKMHQLLPTHMFLAMTMVSLSVNEQIAYIWNAGMEDSFIFDSKTGELRQRIGSFHPPLGISANLLLDIRPEVIPLTKDDRIILYSDGIVEARNAQGDFFGEQRLIEATQQGFVDNDVKGHIIAALEVFCEDLPQDDDISLVDINCDVSVYQMLNLQAETDKEAILNSGYEAEQAGSWSWQMALTGEKLATVNPIPIIINQITEMEGPGDQWHGLYTVLTELYVNALDHGVLDLDSSLKSSPEGFAQYFQKKEERLADLGKGYIKIKLEYTGTEQGGTLDIMMIDSGTGFEFTPWVEEHDEIELAQNEFSGRGIKLVTELCQKLSYHEDGSAVKAIYTWNK
ncbi:fused response regulator/phosphatase [Psychrobium sp. MM17-31]|uniref:fused response regulator/phosphatase n=1 Tax=Psychrobium sp. MM17-31 TaxID=2917758 RepID=UPI001EF5EC56|nr:fused response regulator/phosphatase [Psychrobium sp. MM17-31]MCG7531826.1 fused response regulator/phosphatase [Psychrobium sp. MM17-31]